jgi:diguanylate cyclase (GGDEF)-like protein
VRSDKGVITISVGVAALVPDTGHTVEELLRTADAALYRAKADGRNQAVLAHDL